MNRCEPLNATTPRTEQRRAMVASLALLAASLWPATSALAEIEPRQFPRHARRAVLEVTMPPEVLIDGTAARLAPGARIHDRHNMLAMSAALVGQRLVVNLILEPGGLVHEVWILTGEEEAQKMPYAHAPRNFQFQSEINTTPQDDGHTPFNRLPKFPQSR